MISVSDILGNDLPSKIELHGRPSVPPIRVLVPKGKLKTSCPAGDYRAFVYVYDVGVPVLVDVQSISLRQDASAIILTSVLEGAGEPGALGRFDVDLDLVLGKVELKEGTNPRDPASLPGRVSVPLDGPVLDDEEDWYRGELHARSTYGGGSEDVRALVKRAQRENLDFLAITDRNTMAASMDPDFKSKSVVLIPAMEWGDEEHGVALIYGPRTVPEPADTYAHAQAILGRVQLQGGVFVVAHPCFPTGMQGKYAPAPWQWGLDFVNGVEVFCREWRSIPPVRLADIDEDLKVRRKGKPLTDENGRDIPGKFQRGKLMYPIAHAAATSELSANGQAEVFWDALLDTGLRVSPIGGSLSSSSKVRLARPITYIHAKNKSLGAILQGLRNGRTYVSSGPDGPTVGFYADTDLDGDIDVYMGGSIPMNATADLLVDVKHAVGKKVQIFRDGSPILSKPIRRERYGCSIRVAPETNHVFRVRVVEPHEPDPKKEFQGFGPLDVLALTSPIYVHYNPPEKRAEEKKNINIPIGRFAKPIYVTGVKTEDGETYVQYDRTAAPGFLPPPDPNAPIKLPPGAQVVEIPTAASSR